MPRSFAGSRQDGNHKEIHKLFVELGCQVTDTHAVGKGFPDMVVTGWGQVALVEVKDGSLTPSRRKLTPDEAAWHERCQALVHIVEWPKDAIDVAHGMWLERDQGAFDRWLRGLDKDPAMFALIRERYNL